MWQMIIKRILRGALTIVIVVLLIFFLLRVIPGDPAALMAGEEASEEQIAAITEQWGLNESLWTQLTVYLQSLISGNAGMSYQYATTDGVLLWKVTDLVQSRLPYTIQLASAAIAISVMIAIPLGVLMARKQNSIIDNTISVINYIIISFPVFFIGIILIMLLSLKLSWFPVGGEGSLLHLILPAFTLSMHFTVTLMRMTKTEVSRILTSDYIRMCRAKGLSNVSVLFVHCLRNAAIPLITLIGLRFGAMLGGSMVVEALFRWPGIGNLLISAVKARDYPTVQFLVPYVALVFIIINIVVDLLYGVLDPRIHREA